MRIFLTLAVVVGLSTSFAAQLSAQTLVKNNGPAETPPASFKGKQYVDSRGCVFIRAGFGGRVTWVPRVNRKRQVLCNSGNKPSVTASRIKASQPVVKDVAPARVVKAAPVRVKRLPSTRVVRSVPRKTVVRKAIPATRTQPIRIIRTVPTRSIAQPRVTRLATANSGGLNVRRGPQAIHPADVARQQGSNISRRSGGTIAFSNSNTRRVTVANNSRQRTSVVDSVHGLPVHNRTIPADVTPRGNAQTALVWTNTVPRKLVRADTRIRRVQGQTATLERQAVTPRRVARATGGGRYVQVGSFGVRANASKLISRLSSRGLPTRTRHSGGMTVVLAGPFSSNAASRSALSKARGMGFHDAFYTR